MSFALLQIRRWLRVGTVVKREYVLPAAPTREELEACSDLFYMADWVTSPDSPTPALSPPSRN